MIVKEPGIVFFAGTITVENLTEQAGFICKNSVITDAGFWMYLKLFGFKFPRNILANKQLQTTVETALSVSPVTGLSYIYEDLKV